MRPLVGVAGYRKPVEVAPGCPEPALVLPERYLAILHEAGAEPVVLPYGADVLARLDGLVLAGGGDVDPVAYGQPPEPEVAGIDAERDDAERFLALDAMRRELPVLAICRGVQVLNVALGGTLRQHLGEDVHRDASTTRGLPHEIRAAPGSRVASACGQRFTAWSSHHQGLDRLGEGLQATAWAPDGVIEAVEHFEGWTVGVQWHPEVQPDGSQLALVRAFVSATLSR